MALVFTLFVTVLALAIASSYLGMTISGQKVARAYTQEATAISLTQLGLESMLQAAGDHNNWIRVSDSFVDVFQPDNYNSAYFYVNRTNRQGIEPNFAPKDKSGIRFLPLDGSTPGSADSLTAAQEWFGADFIKMDAYARCYASGPITLNYGGVPKVGYIISVVKPENDLNNNANSVNVGGVRIPRDNKNYIIGVVSLVLTDRGDTNNLAPANLRMNNNVIVRHLEGSRAALVRASFVFPGSQIQNVVSADYPNTPHSTEGEFGYPNYAEYTANAAFIDENCEWDGALRVDGPNVYTGYGAPRVSANGNFAGITQGSGGKYNMQNFGNIRNNNINTTSSGIDTSGIVRISTLDGNAMGNVSSAGAIRNKLNAMDSVSANKYLPEFKNTVSTQKGIIYTDIASDTSVSLNESDTWKDKVFSAKTNAYEQEVQSNSIDTVWKTGSGSNERSLLSGVKSDGSPVSGVYRDMMSGSNARFDFSTSDYKPDPMYANETMEVPTVRVDISHSNNQSYDTYTVSRVTYNYNNGTWQETVTPIRTLHSNDNGMNGMLYFSGANVQVKGTASQSVTIVSDVNPDLEAANYNAIRNNTTNSIFDNKLNSPNVISGGKYKYVDPQQKTDNTWTVNTSISSNNQGAICQDKTNTYVSRGDGYRFPTYSEDEQPMGNISIIGDITKANNSNPSIGIVASNRILLNDFSHKASQSNAADAPSSSSITAANKGNAGDGVLTVEALVASEKHNMAFDFNNLSKNTEYVKDTPNYSTNNNGTSSSYRSFASSNGFQQYAPGDTVVPTGATLSSSNTNFGMLVDKNLASALGIQTNSAAGNYNPDALVSDDGKGHQNYFFYKYSNMSNGARQQVWSDAYRGAIRVDSLSRTNSPYSNGALNFKGLMISRFGDINADAGERDNITKKRINQLGYKNQFIAFDSNLLDNACPYFTTTNEQLRSYGSCIRWNVLTYIDKGALSWNDKNNKTY